MMSANELLRCPLFEGSQFTYVAFQVEPQSEELMGMLGGPVTTRFTAIGTARFEHVQCASDGSYTVSGWLDSSPGAGRLQIEGGGQLRQASTAATFEATCTPATEGGRAIHLVGWVSAEQPTANGRGRVIAIRGTIRETALDESGLGVGVFTLRRV